MKLNKKSLSIVILCSIAIPHYIKSAAMIPPTSPGAPALATPAPAPSAAAAAAYKDPPLIRVIKSIDRDNKDSIKKASAEIDTLLAGGAEIDAPDNYGKTALIWAYLLKIPYMITKLLRANANINVYFKPYAQGIVPGINPWSPDNPAIEETLLLYLIEQGIISSLDRLPGADLTLRQRIIIPHDGSTREGATALQLAIDAHDPQLSFVDMIIRRTGTALINSSYVDNTGTTRIPLSSAYINGFSAATDLSKQVRLYQITKLLLDKGAFIHYEEPKESTRGVNPFVGRESPLSIILNTLPSSNDNLNPTGLSFLNYAKIKAIDLHLDTPNITTGYPLLIAMAIKGNLEACKLLLDYGANINARVVHADHVDDGNTALMQVIIDKHLSRKYKLKVIKFLLTNKADPDIRNAQRLNAYHLAVFDQEILEILNRYSKETKASAAAAPAAPPPA